MRKKSRTSNGTGNSVSTREESTILIGGTRVCKSKTTARRQNQGNLGPDIILRVDE